MVLTPCGHQQLSNWTQNPLNTLELKVFVPVNIIESRGKSITTMFNLSSNYYKHLSLYLQIRATFTLYQRSFIWQHMEGTIEIKNAHNEESKRQ